MANGNFGGGSGVSGDPYLIEDAADLNAVRNYTSSYFKQTADINLSGYSPWEPIPYFTGEYDGNGYRIAGLIASRSGLFEAIGNNGIVKSLGIIEANVQSTDNHVGVLAGTNVGIIEKCYATGIVAGKDWVGGLVGLNNLVVSDCFASVSVTGTNYVGGLIGSLSGGMRFCYSAGAVSGSAQVGGLVGHKSTETDPQVYSCYYDRETSGQSDAGKGEPKTTAEMQTKSTFVDWDFDTIWDIATGYPYLRGWAVMSKGYCRCVTNMKAYLKLTGTSLGG
jgi:hypothetical protein